MGAGYSVEASNGLRLLGKRLEENRRNRKLCHLNPFEFFDHTGIKSMGQRAMGSQ
jgi:hypothetical protein